MSVAPLYGGGSSWNYLGRSPAAFGEALPPWERSARRTAGASPFGGGAAQGAWEGPPAAWRASAGGVVEVIVRGQPELVEIDAELGPKVLSPGGVTGYLEECQGPRRWSDLSVTEQRALAYQAARQNRAAAESALLPKALAAPPVPSRVLSPEEKIAERCRTELSRSPVQWRFIGIDTVTANADKKAPGMLYGLEFPWSAEMLAQMGPAWLTKAFHAAGTLDKDNKVTKVIIDKEHKITAGNNAGKFLFEVAYAKSQPGLHTKLFAKIPFPLGGPTHNDRLSSSVNKQPMDLYEINTYRLLEAALPVKTPKFYYGDVSNDTTNYILITERVPFSELNGRKKTALKPYEVEGPYSKCKDFELRGPSEDYYGLLVRIHAVIAGAHKAGKLGDDEVLSKHIPFRPNDPAIYGMNPTKATGEAPASLRSKLNQAIKFFSETAKVLYPDYVLEERFQNKFRDTLLKVSAYSAEINFWKHSDPDYVAFGHQNLNIDNAYFWRDEAGKLDCGIFDFGGFSSSSLSHRIWWGFNCCDFDSLQAHLPSYLDSFITTYEDHGGPRLDRRTLEMGVMITALENTLFMVAAVPNSLRMCPVKEWATIQDRHDPRIASDVDGKSTLRTTLHVLLNGIRVLEELKADEWLESWVQDIMVGKWAQPAKSDAIINGT